ncbi:ATPase [Pseudoalteromonas phage pYD6-A]|uniref:ATPase n=1 Tax=Pseudoalteromonas phage pYD6-A TaxID=754052 RepID=M4T3X4_9CAUD|nr:ATPase [Pseudoalteromonas phage pYD6-A]AGH57574.1 ATPase [Pseudoalteromonas phage pYD6-A]
MKEIWKDIKDYENLYEISNFGRFRKHKCKLKEGREECSLLRAIGTNRDGYSLVTLSKNGIKKNKTVHQLVAGAFMSNFSYGQQLNHIDGDKTNNHIDNLECTSFSKNNAHAHALGLNPKKGKSKYHNVSIQFDKRAKNPKPKYMAAIKIDSKRHYIGSFSDEISAAKAVDSFLDSIGDTIRQRNFP